MPKPHEPSADSLVAETAIEVLDDAGKTLLIMPQRQVVRQKLRRHAILVCLRNTKGHIFLYKKTAAHSGEAQGTWFPAAHGHLVAGESRHDAGTRLLEQTFGISGVELFEAARFRQPVENPGGNAVTTLFLTAKTALIPKLREEEATDGIFVDKEEFQALMRDYPHLVTPLWNLALPCLFP